MPVWTRIYRYARVLVQLLHSDHGLLLVTSNAPPARLGRRGSQNDALRVYEWAVFALARAGGALQQTRPAATHGLVCICGHRMS